eukprot:TRINITY_DN406_c0_g1_i3.p1 TRINITY_DN406_c0_g1~~TRINITY_DN406_c0_g1_i3.p1  ORF type:complete len:186 (-),score=29.89 TRINITY_DN406_c0_g1_i3:79-636(-)
MLQVFFNLVFYPLCFFVGKIALFRSRYLLLQDNLLGNWMHWLNIGIVLAMGIMWLGTLVVGFNNTTHIERQENCTGSCFSFWRGKTVSDLNALYTHPEVFRTPFMAGLGWFGMLMGTWWWQMGISLFHYEDWANSLPVSAAPHKAVILLGQNILAVTFISIFMTEVLKKIERSKYPHKGLEMEEV